MTEVGWDSTPAVTPHERPEGIRVCPNTPNACTPLCARCWAFQIPGRRPRLGGALIGLAGRTRLRPFAACGVAATPHRHGLVSDRAPRRKRKIGP